MKINNIPTVTIDETPSTIGEPDASATPAKVTPDLADFQNPHKIFHHLDRMQELKETADTRPVHLTLGLTNYCNHKCPWCYINWNQAGRTGLRAGASEQHNRAVSADLTLINAVAEAKELGLKAVTIVGDGEPTLHPKFEYFIEQLSNMSLDIGIFSNFSIRKQSVLDAMLKHCFFIRGSIDAASAKSHRLSHGSDDFDVVIKNLAYVVENRSGNNPIIGVQFVVNHQNYQEIVEAAKLFKSIGVDYLTLKPAYKNELNVAHEENEVDLKQAFELMQEAESYSSDTFKVYAKYPQFKEVVGQKTNDARYYKKCYATPLSPYLDEDGSLEMCGNLKGRGFKIGNVLEHSFKELWNSERRKDCLARIDLYSCPAGCRLDPLNKVLWDTFHPDTMRVHPNFL